MAFFGDITNPNNTAHVLAANLKCHNGYINIVDKVFVIPPDVQTVLAEQGTSDFIEALDHARWHLGQPLHGHPALGHHICADQCCL